MYQHEFRKEIDTGRAGGTTHVAKAWVRRNWLVFFLVLLGLGGVALALTNYLVPCVKEAVTSYNEVPFVNVTRVENNVVRLVPLDMHVTLDHSGSMSNSNKFENAKRGIAKLWETVSNATANITKRPDAAPGTSPQLRFALSKWNNYPSEVEFTLTDLQSALAGIDRFDDSPNSGTAIGTGLARCVLELVPALTSAPTRAPSYAPTTMTNGDGTVVIEDADALVTTQACLVVTDGVAYDNAIVYAEGKTDDELVDECKDRTTEYLSVYPGSEHSKGVRNTLRRTCSATVKATAMADVILACQRLGLTETGDCTPRQLAAAMRARDIVIVGMYVGTAAIDVEFGQKFLKNITSCYEPQYVGTVVNDSHCPFFISSSAEDIIPAATTLASALVDSFASETVSQTTTITNSTTILQPATVYICPGEPLFFVFLLLLAPLGAYLFWRPFTLLFSKYCCAPAPDEPEFVYMDPLPAPSPGASPQASMFAPTPQVMERRNEPVWTPAPAPRIVEHVEPPKPAPNVLVKEKRYKWSLKASDNYLWNLGAAGVGPMHVNFNGVAPPSAPKLEATKANMKRRTQRVSMRWSYVPPAQRSSAGASTRITSAIYDAVVPNYERASDRLEPFHEDEKQPGDLDYEYTMCLMRWFPCLRPSKPPAGTASKKPQAPGQLSSPTAGPRLKRAGSSLSTITNNQGKTGNPRFGNAPQQSAWNVSPQVQGISYTGSDYGHRADDAQNMYSPATTSPYAPRQFGGNSYTSSQFGGNSYASSQFGDNSYASSQFGGSSYAPSQYTDRIGKQPVNGVRLPEDLNDDMF